MSFTQVFYWILWRQRARRFPRRFNDWLRSRKRGPHDHQLLLAAFLESGGESLSRASEVAALTYGTYDFSDQPSSIGLVPGSREYTETLLKLQQDGYTILPWRLNEMRIAAISNYFSSCLLTAVSDDPVLDGQRISLMDDSPVAEKYDVAIGDILRNADALDLMLDRGVLQLAQDYLGSVPRIDICAAWFSYPVNRASNRAATTFHFDLDRLKWLKVFYFLTDVTPTSGAHVFIPGSQRDDGIPKALLKRGYERLADRDVEGSFPRGDWMTITGARGTILLEDTRGLHKGLPVIEGHRLVLQYQYSQDLFGNTPTVSGHSIPSNMGMLGHFASSYPAVLEGFVVEHG